MKKLLSLLLLIISEPLLAQKHLHEVYMAYGFVTPLTIEFNSGWGSSNSKVKKTTLGPMSLGYRYFLSPAVAVGGQASYIKQKRDYLPAPGMGTSSSTTTEATALLVRTDFYYVRRPTMKVYSGVGVGWLRERRSDSQYPSSKEQSLTPHLTVVGIRVGERIAGFAELGLSINGVFQVGLAIRP